MLKALSRSDYTIIPFITHKNQYYTYISGGFNNPQQVILDVGINPPAFGYYYSTSDPTNADGTDQYLIYRSIKQIFYTSASYISGTASPITNQNLYPANTSGSTAMNWGAGGSEQRLLPLANNIFVFSIAQQTWGEGIRPGSFTITSPQSVWTIQDDSQGRLYAISSINQGGNFPSGVIGNVFYDTGIAVLNSSVGISTDFYISFSGSFYITNFGSFYIQGQNDPVSLQGINIQSGTILDMTFDATQTIYEHNVMVTIEPFEFNWSTNVSAFQTASTGQAIPDLFLSGGLVPYVTTLGLYDKQQQLIAVAKFPQPIKRILESQQTFIIKLDA